MRRRWPIAVALSLAVQLSIPMLAQGQAPEKVMATNLEAEVGCSDIELRQGIAKLRWINSPLGSGQRIEFTKFGDGFERGEFETMGLPPDQSSGVWEDLEPGLNHYWRVVTLHGNTWVPSETATFMGPICAVNLVPMPNQ